MRVSGHALHQWEQSWFLHARFRFISLAVPWSSGKSTSTSLDGGSPGFETQHCRGVGEQTEMAELNNGGRRRCRVLGKPQTWLTSTTHNTDSNKKPTRVKSPSMTFRSRITPTLYNTNMTTLPTQITRGRPQWKTMQIRPGQNIWGTEAQSRWPCLWPTESPGPEWGVWLNCQLPQAASLTLRHCLVTFRSPHYKGRLDTGTDRELTVNKNHLKKSKAAVGVKGFDKYAKLKRETVK